MEVAMNRLFKIVRNGDWGSPNTWNVQEYKESFDEPTCTFRGDLSPVHGRDRTIRMLRRMYPGCKIKVER